MYNNLSPKQVGCGRPDSTTVRNHGTEIIGSGWISAQAPGDKLGADKLFKVNSRDLHRPSSCQTLRADLHDIEL